MNAPLSTTGIAAPSGIAAPGVLPREASFDPADRAILARHWYPVALSRDVGDAPVAARLLDERLVIWRVDGVVTVAPDWCPHRGVPLSLGTLHGDGLACLYHGLRFGAGGACIHVPAHPDRAVPGQFHLRAYPAVERYGMVWTCLDPSAQTAIPEMPHWDEPGFQQINCPPVDIGGFAGRQLEGFLDVAHFAFVHTATFADPGNATVPAYRPERTDYGFEAKYFSSVGNYPAGAEHKGPEGFTWLRHFRCTPPFTATLEIHFPKEARLVIMNCASPVSARQTRMFAPIARNFDTDLPVQDVYDFNARVFEEDRLIVETQEPAFVPLDPAAEAHLPADMSSMVYRRLLKDMGLKFANPV